ncbi:MAG: beta-N-acetylhexosaminidase [Planctomycetota bacterium]
MTEAERLAARMLCVGFDGHVPDDAIRRLIDRGVGGVVLFARNVDSPEQVLALNAALKQHAGDRPLLTCVDQEGGRVARLRRGFTQVPAMRDVRDADHAAELGDVLGRECRAVGFDLNFAPVLDVDTNPANPVIADRSLGRDPQRVAELGTALVRGMQNHVAACGKHFPGHGDTAQDSHHDLPRLPHDLDRLRQIELKPFAAVADEIAAIMTAHIVFEALDDKPGTMSKPVLDLLRQDLGFDGVIISDDFEMKALFGRFDFEHTITTAALAGVDLLVVCHREDLQHRAIDALATLPIERLRAANRRIDVLCARFCKPAVGDLAVLPKDNAIINAGVDPTDFRKPTQTHA